MDEELVGDGAEGAEGEFVFDFVVEEGAAAVGLDGVAVAPVFEGAAELDVAEAFEPAEVFDEGVPGEADGGEGDGADGEGEARAGAGGDAVGAGEGIGRRRGRDVGGVLDARVLPGGHEAGEVGGVGEEGEDLLEGVGQALFGLEVETHGFIVSVPVGLRCWVSGGEEMKDFGKKSGVPKDATLLVRRLGEELSWASGRR